MPLQAFVPAHKLAKMLNASALVVSRLVGVVDKRSFFYFNSKLSPHRLASNITVEIDEKRKREIGSFVVEFMFSARFLQ